MKIYEHYSLERKHTFHIHVKSRYYIEYASVEELISFLTESPLIEKYPLFHMGGGSNLLFLGDYNGIILHSAIRFIELLEENSDTVLVRVGAGIVWDDFVAYCIKNNWYGIENLSYIPGEAGASAVQNIGAYGVEVGEVIEKIETLDLKQKKARFFRHDECQYAYRDSIFKNELRGKYIITAVQYRLRKNAPFRLDYGNLKEIISTYSTPTLVDVREAVGRIRHSKLPDTEIYGNAGSFFKNPIVSISHYETLKKSYPDMPYYPIDKSSVKLPAGWLIDRAGWRGKIQGRAAVYDKQSLVLINRGGATAQDIVELAEKICKSVKELYDIELFPEVNYVQ
ncbi:MAG: UDP-N-acetylmuramate dehydrogenase [Porphyromonadaceae bacterium]|nr:UDP-N-acetylmuramate dehydrogenase [Porphyromonadaceae bacterium]